MAGQGPPPEMMKKMMEQGGPTPEMMEMMKKMMGKGGPPPEMMKMMMEKGGPPPEMMQMMMGKGGPPPEMMKMMMEKGGAQPDMQKTGSGPPPDMMKKMMEKGGPPPEMIAKLKAKLDAPNTAHNGQHLPIEAGMVQMEKLEALEKFEFRDDDVIVASYPKAGTHWAQDICAKILLEGDMEKANTNARPVMELTTSGPPDGKHKVVTTVEEMAQLPSPRTLGTHLWYANLPASVRQGNTKIVYIWRDAKDCAVSNIKFLKDKFPLDLFSDDRMIDMFVANESVFGSWPDHLRSYFAEAKRPNVLIINYEEMKKDLLSTVRRIATHLGKSLPEELLVKIADSCTIEVAKKSHEGSVFLGQGKSGVWKEFLTVAQSERIDMHMKQQNADDIQYPN